MPMPGLGMEAVQIMAVCVSCQSGKLEGLKQVEGLLMSNSVVQAQWELGARPFRGSI